MQLVRDSQGRREAQRNKGGRRGSTTGNYKKKRKQIDEVSKDRKLSGQIRYPSGKNKEGAVKLGGYEGEKKKSFIDRGTDREVCGNTT